MPTANKFNFNKKNFSLPVAGRDFHIEISELAGQANASVLATYGDTVVLATAVMGNSDRPGDFFPLMVDYEERFYAAGKILGSRFMRREGRASDEAVLSGRLIDRSIRPLFDSRLRREVQIVITIISIDEKNDPDFVSLMAASTALAISDIPWKGPVAGLFVGQDESGQLVVNPPIINDPNGQTSPFLGFFAGPEGKINMIEISADEASESAATEAATMALAEINKLVTWQKEIVEKIGKPKADIPLLKPSSDLISAVKSIIGSKLEDAVFTPDKKERASRLSIIKEEIFSSLADRGFASEDLSFVESVLEDLTDEIVHRGALDPKSPRRQDGRSLDDVRPLHASTSLFKRTHGSALFVRGDTQSLSVVTLAPPGQEKTIETIETTGKKRFFLHYNFPPYSVGEVKFLRGPGRREIGHGSLAEKALRPMIPSTEKFPYTIRLVSEILSSNGSSSMATVCAGSLALMDAGVPIKKPVAGIAMGIMTNADGDYKILTDIQGAEDHYGDMDFKVAGTKDGITAIQMDVKMDGITPAILSESLAAAKNARLSILEVMLENIESPRPDISPYAPKVDVIKIDPSKIGMVIGPGGKTINNIIDRLGVTIDIDDSGEVYIGGPDSKSVDAAVKEVQVITKDFNIGEIVEGEVVRLMDFGAIVDLGGGKDGMVHVSEIKDGFVKTVSDVLKVGDFVRAKIIKLDNGKIGLSIKQAEPGEKPQTS